MNDEQANRGEGGSIPRCLGWRVVERLEGRTPLQALGEESIPRVFDLAMEAVLQVSWSASAESPSRSPHNDPLVRVVGPPQPLDRGIDGELIVVGKAPVHLTPRIALSTAAVGAQAGSGQRQRRRGHPDPVGLGGAGGVRASGTQGDASRLALPPAGHLFRDGTHEEDCSLLGCGRCARSCLDGPSSTGATCTGC